MRLNENQRLFFRTLRHYDIVVDSGTWRSGKSFELCLFAILRMKTFPGIREFVGRRELSALRETTFLKFQEILTEFFRLKESTDYELRLSPRPEISFPNGSTCVFGDLDVTRINKWLSAEYSDIIVDEAQEIAEIAFEKMRSRQTQKIIETLSRGRRKNKFVMAMNPPEIAERHWTHKKFRDPETRIANAVMIYSTIENNRDNIPKHYIEDMFASVDARTAEIYLRGHWTPLLSKLVYPDYLFPTDSGGRYIEGGNLAYLEPRLGLENYISLDFGWVHPMSVGCWQYDRQSDCLYRLYEVVESYLKPDLYCDLLAGSPIVHNNRTYRLPFHAGQAILVMGIEARQRRQESNGRSNLQIMKDLLAQRGVSPRIRVVSVPLHNSILAVRNHIVTACGERRLLVDPRYCQRFIADCLTYHYPTDLQGNILSEEPDKDNVSDHTQDETRYLLGWLSPIGGSPVWTES